MIEIWSSDVEIDLMGRTLGRGRIFKDAGKGTGINIVDTYDIYIKKTKRLKNIIIKNGRIQDSRVGIARNVSEINEYDPEGRIAQQGSLIKLQPVRQGNGMVFPEDNILLENLEFENNIENINFTELRLVPIPGRITRENGGNSKESFSGNPPCGGSDYFGRPLGKEDPCDRIKDGK
jgi:hypothetical protein